ncbi:hypothetical protein Sipo8835_35705 [Streptomyces ipomoeae]|uniref:Uncharacterized protein n=1 Tax=Streptomyces ipomoeae TaxID=103232 RepID=A0AAE8VVX7_9ACTN|nr:hypothetical protein [Streptomyces ipomoeae]TQE22543.1 hypothetical protein Sipo8835_35705 [Streptomyces ipomoeae]
MLFKLTGSSCSGKTTLAFAVAGRIGKVAVHDTDELGVPEDADLRWRHRMTEMWVRRALDYQDCGIDLLLSGQSPLGELLAAPSAPLLDGIAVCLVDVTAPVQRARLAERDPGRWDPEAIDAYIGWAAWHRKHAHDPSHRPDVIIDNSWPEMVWDRWTGWNTGDPRWRTQVLDTTDRPITESVDQVEQWINEQRHAHQAGQHPLSHGWGLVIRPNGSVQ